ncbi:MAG TPA: DUF4097 family beta strand repeat-containing protein [Terriglobales bacterium]|nr:DUF4097 family beta strand repeat-containing protein [Terriglobales bacterium]
MRKTRLLTFVAWAALLLLPLPALAASEGSFSRTLNVSAGDVDLNVQTGSGNITVRTGNDNSVRVEGRIHARGGWSGMSGDEKVQRLEANPPIEQNGNWIRIGRIDDGELRRNVSIDYELVVPARSRLSSETGSGDQRISGLKGAVRAHTGSGNLTLADIAAETRAESGSGDLDLSNITGRMYVATGSGNIRTSRVAGAFVGSSGSGDIHLDETASGEVKATTGSGNVVVTGVNGPLDVSTGSGDVEVSGQQRGDWQLEAGSGNVRLKLAGEPSFDLDAHSSSGSIDVDFPITVQGTMRRNQIQGRVRNGGQLLKVHTGSGDIEIR